jgi:hypothetical protein
MLMQLVASDVCKDLILYDTPNKNHFRELIPLAHDYPVLLQIIIAISAIRMSHTRQKIARPHGTTGLLHQSETPTTPQSQDCVAHSQTRSDALAAKFKALNFLQSALSNEAPMDLDVTLAVVLLFVEFELLDSGRDDWIHHIDGARKIIEKLCGLKVFSVGTISPLRRCLISNCLMYVDSFWPRSILLTLKQI